MNTIFMLTCMVLIFLFAYLISDKSFVNPIVLFCLPLIVSVTYGLKYYSGWRFNVSSETMILVIFSFFVFCFAVFLVSAFIKNRSFKRNKTGHGRYGINTALLLEDNIYVLLFVLQIFAALICFLQERKIVLANGYGGGLSEVIGNYNNLTKFGDDDVSLPGFASLAAGMQQGMAYILGYLFSMDRIHGSRKTYKIVLFVLTVVLLTVSGSRTNSIGLLFGTLVMYLLLRCKAGKAITLRNIKAKYVLFIPIAVVMLLIVFFESLTLLGRNEESDFFYYIAIYLSAPMKNLDLAITRGIVHSDFWGQLSFKYLYPSLEKLNLVPAGSMYGTFRFLSFNGYFLGNVYTTFYALLVDFGFAGCLLAVAIMAAMSQCAYSVALRSRNSYSVAVILYAFISFQLFMSFFSSNFYQNIFNTGFIKFIIPIVLFKCYVSIKSSRENELLS